jgi:soluble lytic murein transglycosylase-like protein
MLIVSFKGILCSGVLSLFVSESDGWDSIDHGVAMTQCVNVLEESIEQDVDPFLSLSIAWHESRFIYLEGWSSSAHGVMQVLPRYHCPDGVIDGCDSARAGVRYLRERLERTDWDYSRAACLYHDGNSCKSSGRIYSSKVMENYDRLQQAHGRYSC